jgi:hypothetical protein
MKPSKMLRLAAGAACAALLVSQAALAAPAPAPAAATTRPALTAAQIQAMEQVAAQSLAADVAAKRQALAQQTAQRHQTQLTALRAALPANVQTLSGARLGAVPSALTSGAAMKPLAPMGTLTVLSKTTSTNPVIQQISVTEGDPGTPVLLNGDGFGDTAGEVHFIVANGKDLKATTAYWSNGQIMTEVPYLDGVNAYDGIVYVQHFDGRKSSFSSFRFKPPLDVVVLGTPDCTVKAKDIWGLNYCAQYKDSLVSSQAADNVWIAAIEHLSEIASFNADDLFWMTNTLKNGWIVSSCGVLVADRTFRGTATVTECRAGTNSPFTKVHWWIDSASGSSSIITYAPRVTITGPKGLPYF